MAGDQTRRGQTPIECDPRGRDEEPLGNDPRIAAPRKAARGLRGDRMILGTEGHHAAQRLTAKLRILGLRDGLQNDRNGPLEIAQKSRRDAPTDLTRIELCPDAVELFRRAREPDASEHLRADPDPQIRGRVHSSGIERPGLARTLADHIHQRRDE